MGLVALHETVGIEWASAADRTELPTSTGFGLGGRGGAIPVAFGPADLRCTGWFHRSRGPSRGVGVVLCKPLGFEGSCAHEAVSALAAKLAATGFPVVRFDYHGTGDSPGRDVDAARVAAWRKSVKNAVAEVQRLGGVRAVSLVGIRAGATLAIDAAAEAGGAASLVLWAPCTSGRIYARELRVSSVSARKVAPDGPDPDQNIAAFGFVFTKETLADLVKLDPSRLSLAPAPRVLIVGRDDMPGEGPLHGVLRRTGASVEHRDLPGFVSMMQEPRVADVEEGTLDAIVDWLESVHPAGETTSVSVRGAAPSIPALACGEVRETPLIFGARHNLFGVMAEPVSALGGDPRERVAVLMLSVGTNYHIGPSRIYVTMARELAAAGYRSLRFDLAPIGDSRIANDNPEQRTFDKKGVSDVRAAMDRLTRHGCEHFVLVGLCSGAYTAFQSALADDRVIGQILINPRRLTGRAGDTLQAIMSESFKSTDFYRRAVLDGNTYARLFRGKIDTRGILKRLFLLSGARARRVASRLSGGIPNEGGVLADLQGLCTRGTDTLVLVAPDDDGLDYMQFHLGANGRRMQGYPNFEMRVVEGTDHTFSQPESQELAVEATRALLDRRYFRGPNSTGSGR